MTLEQEEVRAPDLPSWAGWIVFAAVPLVACLTLQQRLYAGIPASFLWMSAVVGVLCLVAAILAVKNPGVPSVAALGVALLTVYYCGPASTVAFAILVLTAFAIGSLFDPRQAWPPAMRLLAGIAAMVAVVGWLLPFPVHSGRAYLFVAAALCWWRRGFLLREWHAFKHAWQPLAHGVPGWLLLATAAGFVAALGLWLPSLNYDDNSAHLILPYQLLADGYYHLDVSTQVWAVAPWANNVLHGIAALLAGQEARPAANLLWLLVGFNGAWRLAREGGASPATGLAAVAVFASLPLTGYFTATMQVDGASAAVLMQLGASLLAARRSLPPALAVGIALALLAGLKATNVLYALPAMVWMTWLALRQGNLRWLAIMVASAAVLAGASYFYSTWITGNPLFPLFNGTFKSPYYPQVDFVDSRWITGLSWRSPWDATFHTDRFGEVYPGAWGFALLALLPAILLDMLRESRTRYLVLWFTLSGVVVFGQVQYLRYVFPAMAALVVVGVAGLGRITDRRLFATAVLILVAGNALLLPTTSWMARENPWLELLRSGTAAAPRIEARMAPTRALLRRVLAADAQACILVADAEAPYIAVAGGRAQSIKGSYDPRMATSFEWAKVDATGARWPRFLQLVGPSHVLTGGGDKDAFTGALARSGYEIEDTEGGLSVWVSQVPGQPHCTGDLERVRDEAHRRLHPGDQH